ncbi:MAG: 30S ribosomal protein S20 [Synergistales bacterium]|nr:30S ribosomal protein S20 [Synergistales bacterium]
MPTHKSAEKRIRTSEKQRVYNKHWRTMSRTARKRVIQAVEAGDRELAMQRLNRAYSVLDRATVKGVLHKNTSSRYKKRLNSKVHGMQN